VKPATFEYVAAHTVEDALQALASNEDARVIAGGQSLVPLMNMRLARPALLVDVNAIEELDSVQVSDGEVRIGALCRHRRLERDGELAAAAPLVQHAARRIGHPSIRNRGTLGGSIAHADPAGELPAAAVALGARVSVRSSQGTREIPAADLFEGFFTTTLAPGELVIDVVVPRVRGAGAAFVEYTARPGDFAIVGVGVQIVRDASGRCTSARAGACGVAATPHDASHVLADVVGRTELDDGALRTVATAVASDPVEIVGDTQADAPARRELMQALTVAALQQAWARSGRTA
jgi:aerobic carbon-monoxide dehydrogenase medium subunit